MTEKDRLGEKDGGGQDNPWHQYDNNLCTVDQSASSKHISLKSDHSSAVLKKKNARISNSYFQDKTSQFTLKTNAKLRMFTKQN